MGPLSKVWHALESATTTALDDETDLTTEDLLNLVQQTVLLVEQINNTISYHWRHRRCYEKIHPDKINDKG